MIKDDVNEAFDDETYAGGGGIGDGEQLQVFVFVLAKGIVFVLMRGNVFVLLRGIVNGDPVRGQCQMFPANIRRYFAFFISYVNIATSRLLGQLSGLDSDIIYTDANMLRRNIVTLLCKNTLALIHTFE